MVRCESTASVAHDPELRCSEASVGFANTRLASAHCCAKLDGNVHCGSRRVVSSVSEKTRFVLREPTKIVRRAHGPLGIRGNDKKW